MLVENLFGMGIFRWVRAHIVFVFFVVILALFVGSAFMRRHVVSILRQRTLASVSVVLGKVTELKSGVSVRAIHLENRLRRLHYHEVINNRKIGIDSVRLGSPGDYISESDGLKIFLRAFQLESGEQQNEKSVKLEVDSKGVIRSIVDLESNEHIGLAYLEPEIISFLNNGAARASTPKFLEEFPKNLRQAVISVEDERFYSHYGIDPLGILRAIYVNTRSGRFVQGGSTITQQLAKNLFFSHARKLVRKLIEAMSAVLIETAFSKEKILEMYLNEVFLGQEGSVAIHGFGEAAQSFFGKDVKDLSLAESATLAGIVKGPTAYSPRYHPEAAFERRKLVLQKMFDNGLISKREFFEASKEELTLKEALRTTRIASYFVDYLRERLQKYFENYPKGDGGINVNTTLDPEMQICANDALVNGLRRLEKQYPRFRSRRHVSPIQGALIATNPKTGSVLAWVGGRDYGQTQFDRVSKAKRQPGSLFKPFVYLTAFDGSLNKYRVARTTMLLDDKPLTIDIPGSAQWEPKNYEGKFTGEVAVREALVHSMNIPTVGLAMKVGIDNVAHTAELLGLGEGLPRLPALALGAVEATPLDMIRAYTTIASGGILFTPHTWNSVTLKGEATPLVLNPSQEGVRVAAASSVYVLTDVMKDVIEKGTASAVRKLGFVGHAAGKTGTTNEARDAWFAGFTTDILALVWIGFDDNGPIGLTGGVAAVPIWTDFMKCAVSAHVEDFPIPDGVVFRKVDMDSGLLYDPRCSFGEAREEVFVEGTEPVTSSCANNVERQQDDEHGMDTEWDYDRDTDEIVRGGW